MTITRVSSALVGQILLVVGAGLFPFPFLGLLTFLLVPAGAVITCVNALSIKGPEATGDGEEALLIIIGAMVLTFGCMRSVVVNINPYSGGQRGPFSDGPWFNPDTTLLILWLIAPCLLSLGVKLRSSQPDTVLALLFLYWLAFVPLSVAACTLFRLLGFPMSA